MKGLSSARDLICHCTVTVTVTVSVHRTTNTTSPLPHTTTHMQTAPPKVPFTDDITGEPLVRRADDVDEKMRTKEDDEWGSLARRLAVYKEEAGGVVGYYRERGVLAAVPAEAAVEEVMRRVEVVMKGVPGKGGGGAGGGDGGGGEKKKKGV
jgi:adenylate kinase